MSDVTQILSKIEAGDQQASEELLPLVYEELRKLAASRMSSERPEQTLQATALVHEAYIRLVDTDKAKAWNSRGHFFAAAAEAMRRILVERARKKAGPVAGGEHVKVSLSSVDPADSGSGIDVLALNEALECLAAKSPRKAELVKLRFFAGLTNEQSAEALGVTPRTAYADWSYAKAWLRVEMS
jgi:RNA polymerase sigma factor (TIGR02999 family)